MSGKRVDVVHEEHLSLTGKEGTDPTLRIDSIQDVALGLLTLELSLEASHETVPLAVTTTSLAARIEESLSLQQQPFGGAANGVAAEGKENGGLKGSQAKMGGMTWLEMVVPSALVQANGPPTSVAAAVTAPISAWLQVEVTIEPESLDPPQSPIISSAADASLERGIAVGYLGDDKKREALAAKLNLVDQCCEDAANDTMSCAEL